VTGKRKLPPKVHEKDVRYYWVDKNKWTGLSRVEEGPRELHRRLAILTDLPPNTLAGIFAAYMESDAFEELKLPTRKQYEYFLSGVLTETFGHMTPAEIDNSTIAQYLEQRKNKKAAVAGNRERSCLSSAFEFAMRRGWAKRNPCRGVRRNKERPSKVMIESGTLSDSMDRAPPHFAQVMQFAYLTGLRMEDVIRIETSALTRRGIEFTESKTGKDVTIGWTDELRKLVREILESRHERKNSKTHARLLTNRFGRPLSAWGITSNMRRLEAGFSFRHIRPKAQTDAGDRNVIGHVGQMRERYTRRRKLVPVR
jgi:site-specific recombinase XerD